MLGVDEYHAKIVDVGKCWTGYDKVTEALEKKIGIILYEMDSRIEANRRGACQGMRIDDSARGVLGAVDPVRIASQRMNARLASKCDRKTKKVFKVSSAATLLVDHTDGCLAAGNDGAARLVLCKASRKSTVGSPKIARFGLQLVP